MGFSIIQTAKAVPKRVVTNDELATIMPTSDDWIRRRTGIAQRHLATTETTESLCIDVAQQLMDQAGLPVTDLSLIVVATMSASRVMPSVAATVQGAIGASRAMTLDVNAACAGFVSGLAVAHALAQAHQARYVMVIGGEVMSRLLDWHDRRTAVLFGDGAGGVLIDTQATASGVYLADDFMTSGDQGPALTAAPLQGLRSPFVASAQEPQALQMDGHAVYNFVVRQAPPSIRTVLKQANLSIEDVQAVIFHQANARMLTQVAKKLGLRPDQCPQNIAEYGNTAAASEPILLAELMATGQIHPGDKLLLCGFGGGLSIGTILLNV